MQSLEELKNYICSPGRYWNLSTLRRIKFVILGRLEGLWILQPFRGLWMQSFSNLQSIINPNLPRVEGLRMIPQPLRRTTNMIIQPFQGLKDYICNPLKGWRIVHDPSILPLRSLNELKDPAWPFNLAKDHVGRVEGLKDNVWSFKSSKNDNSAEFFENMHLSDIEWS